MNPSGYRELKASSLQILPSERQVKNWRQKSKVNEGINPSFYGTLRDRIKLSSGNKEMTVSLMVDEMKLKHGVYTNVATGSVIGFASAKNTFQWMKDDIDSFIEELTVKRDIGTSDELEEMSDIDDHEPSSYVNQF